jgi:hypothetical protein
MRAVVLCLNFPDGVSRSSRFVQGEDDDGNEMLADAAMIGNAEIVNVLKTTD